MVTTKVGMNKSMSLPFHPTSTDWASESNDPEFDDWNRNFTMIEQVTEKLIKDTKAYMDAVNGMLQCAVHHLSFSVSRFQGHLSVAPVTRVTTLS